MVNEIKELNDELVNGSNSPIRAVEANTTNIVNIGEAGQKRKRGRPSKAALKATRKVGRPKETAGRIAEFKERLLGTAGTKVIDTVVRIALDDKHPGQMAALKMCIDRQLPVSMFEKGVGSRPSIQINITNATSPDESATIDIGDVTDIEVSND